MVFCKLFVNTFQDNGYKHEKENEHRFIKLDIIKEDLCFHQAVHYIALKVHCR